MLLQNNNGANIKKDLPEYFRIVLSDCSPIISVLSYNCEGGHGNFISGRIDQVPVCHGDLRYGYG